jgi:hypothetical protein
VSFGDPDVSTGTAALAVNGLSPVPVPGTSVHVTLSFQSAGTLSIDVPVLTVADLGSTASAEPVPLTGSYPTATETPTATPTAIP